MRLDRRSAIYDLMLRASGVTLAVVGALAIRGLRHLVQAAPRHDATAIELALAAMGFLGLSFGTGLVWLGMHIHDAITISSRWVRQSRHDGPAKRRGR